MSALARNWWSSFRNLLSQQRPRAAQKRPAYRSFLQVESLEGRLVPSVGNSPALKGYDPATKTLAGLSAVYDMDAGGDHWVKLDYRLNAGSGAGDMLLYVPDVQFGSNGGAQYVYLYSQFGQNYAG